MANNIEKLLACLISPAQDIEDALQQLKTQRFIDTAIGAQLDIIGRIVGQLREGKTDDLYRRYIRARVAANNSEGTIEDLLLVAYLVVYDEAATYILKQEGTATARLRIGDVALEPSLGEVLWRFIETAESAGVRIVVQWGESDDAQMFRLDQGPGLDQGHLGSSLG